MSTQRTVKNMEASAQGIIKIHERGLRGKTKMGWLESYHTFSFGSFNDPQRIRFRSLRVINDDIIASGSGFGEHPHRDMEIITYVLRGALTHKDSMGNGATINAGDIQKMSAGSGITHAEFNDSKDTAVHLYQIWIMPDEKGITPQYEQITPNRDALRGGFSLVGDRIGGSDKISIHQDAQMYVAVLDEGQDTRYEFAQGRHGFLQVARGHVTLNGELLKEGDGAEISGVETIMIAAQTDAELILFDLK